MQPYQPFLDYLDNFDGDTPKVLRWKNEGVATLELCGVLCAHYELIGTNDPQCQHFLLVWGDLTIVNNEGQRWTGYNEEVVIRLDEVGYPYVYRNNVYGHGTGDYTVNDLPVVTDESSFNEV